MMKSLGPEKEQKEEPPSPVVRSLSWSGLHTPSIIKSQALRHYLHGCVDSKSKEGRFLEIAHAFSAQKPEQLIGLIRDPSAGLPSLSADFGLREEPSVTDILRIVGVALGAYRRIENAAESMHLSGKELLHIVPFMSQLEQICFVDPLLKDITVSKEELVKHVVGEVLPKISLNLFHYSPITLQFAAISIANFVDDRSNLIPTYRAAQESPGELYRELFKTDICDPLGVELRGAALIFSLSQNDFARRLRCAPDRIFSDGITTPGSMVSPQLTGGIISVCPEFTTARASKGYAKQVLEHEVSHTQFDGAYATFFPFELPKTLPPELALRFLGMVSAPLRKMSFEYIRSELFAYVHEGIHRQTDESLGLSRDGSYRFGVFKQLEQLFDPMPSEHPSRRAAKQLIAEVICQNIRDTDELRFALREFRHYKKDSTAVSSFRAICGLVSAEPTSKLPELMSLILPTPQQPEVATSRLSVEQDLLKWLQEELNKGRKLLFGASPLLPDIREHLDCIGPSFGLLVIPQLLEEERAGYQSPFLLGVVHQSAARAFIMPTPDVWSEYERKEQELLSADTPSARSLSSRLKDVREVLSPMHET